MASGFVVKMDDETAESLTENYSDERISEALTETLEELANEAPRKQSELRRHMGLDEESSDDEELSETELKEEMQAFLRGERKDDPRL